MYFNDKNDTNIDSEFEQENILSKLLKFINKYKIIVFIFIAIILILFMIFIFINRKIEVYLDLKGNEEITLYVDSDYIEPGYDAYNSKKEDLNSEVDINSNLDTSIPGEYEITYSIGDIILTRKIIVIEKPVDYTYIYLKTVNNSVNVYIKVGEDYIEPGYIVFNSSGKNLVSDVVVTGNVDTSKKGSYKLVYSLVDENDVTVSATRTVIVMDSEISLSLSDEEYTNKDITIDIGIVDNYFDYVILPDGSKITTNTYSYNVSENGTYTFTVFTTKGTSKEADITINNIDKDVPNGSCTLDQNEKGSIIIVTASDQSGIKKYEYNKNIYSSNEIQLTNTVSSADVTIYDKAGNNKNIKCSVVPRAYISKINADGVIVTINAKKINKEIAGYYFSYTKKRPDKNSGGYLSTNQETIDVVRLPGTTYVWVEDTVGKISEYKTITISNDSLLNTVGNDYKILQNTRLDDYLKNQGWSMEEFNNLMFRSVRAAGLYTKDAAATSAVALLTVLAQEYKIKLPYWWGGKSWDLGADSAWGTYRFKENEDTNTKYYYYGLDCSGFTTWAYVNAGYRVGADGTNKYPAYFWGWLSKTKDFKKENGEAGDFLVLSGQHVKLIIGKNEKGFITAEAKGGAYGMVVDIHPYNKAQGYKIESGELLMETYGKINLSDYPSGF